MAWWDHEELKSPADRSDRYILAFPSEYSAEQVRDAARRVAAQRIRERDDRPGKCRERLRDEGRAYPKSGCDACGTTVATGVRCLWPSDIPPEDIVPDPPIAVPLVWEEPSGRTNGCWVARTPIGDYSVVFEDGWCASLESSTVPWEWEAPEDPRSYAGPRTAQAACQSHFESVVRTMTRSTT